jgi:superfamily II RNA helicase
MYNYLKKNKYISKNGKLTDKGNFARNIYFQELLISELFSTGFYNKFSNIELLQLIAGIIYEQRKNDHFSFLGIQNQYNYILKKIQKNNYVQKNLNKLSLKRMMAIVGHWSKNGDFQKLLNLTKLDEGDIIRLMRRIIDMIRQIKHATDDIHLIERLDNCQQKIDRDIVKIDI